MEGGLKLRATSIIYTHYQGHRRQARKRWLLDSVENHPGVELELLWKWFEARFGLTKRKFKEYLSELEEAQEVEERSGRLYPYGFEESPEPVQSRFPTPPPEEASPHEG